MDHALTAVCPACLVCLSLGNRRSSCTSLMCSRPAVLHGCHCSLAFTVASSSSSLYLDQSLFIQYGLGISTPYSTVQFHLSFSFFRLWITVTIQSIQSTGLGGTKLASTIHTNPRQSSSFPLRVDLIPRELSTLTGPRSGFSFLFLSFFFCFLFFFLHISFLSFSSLPCQSKKQHQPLFLPVSEFGLV